MTCANNSMEAFFLVKLVGILSVVLNARIWLGTWSLFRSLFCASRIAFFPYAYLVRTHQFELMRNSLKKRASKHEPSRPSYATDTATVCHQNYVQQPPLYHFCLGAFVCKCSCSPRQYMRTNLALISNCLACVWGRMRGIQEGGISLSKTENSTRLILLVRVV